MSTPYSEAGELAPPLLILGVVLFAPGTRRGEAGFLPVTARCLRYPLNRLSGIQPGQWQQRLIDAFYNGGRPA
jgi:hypothetical protein